MGWLIALFGRWALGGLVKAGVSEGAAGGFVTGKLFMLMVCFGLGLGAFWIGKGALALHDSRIEEGATVRCHAERLVKQLQVRVDAQDHALKLRDRRDQEREGELAALQTRAEDLKGKNDALRVSNPNTLCYRVDDGRVQRK